MSEQPAKPSISREAIKAAYRAGEEAVIELVEVLSEQSLLLVETLLEQQAINE